MELQIQIIIFFVFLTVEFKSHYQKKLNFLQKEKTTLYKILAKFNSSNSQVPAIVYQL